MNADWDEIKRLAADFQKAQLSSTLARFVANLKRLYFDFVSHLISF